MFVVRFKSIYLLLIIGIILFISFFRVCNVSGNAYDDAESIRRAGQQLYDIDKAYRDEARRKSYQSENSEENGNTMGFPICVGVIVIMLLPALMRIVVKITSIIETFQKMYKKKYNDVSKKIETQNKGKNYERWKSRANITQTVNDDNNKDDVFKTAASKGFIIESELKECPVCAEMIKLKAIKCRFCLKEFTTDEVDLDEIGRAHV
jgi:hypothetical protein